MQAHKNIEKSHVKSFYTLTHKKIWRGIDQLAKQSGLSASALAKKAGLDPTSFNPSKRKAPDGRERWPSTESIAKILSATNVNMAHFSSIIFEAPEQKSILTDNQLQTIPLIEEEAIEKASLLMKMKQKVSTEKYLSFNMNKNNQSLFAMRITKEMRTLCYQEGDVMLLEQKNIFEPQERLMIAYKEDQEQILKIIPCVFHAKKDNIFILVTRMDHKKIKLEETQIYWMARIVWVSQ